MQRPSIKPSEMDVARIKRALVRLEQVEGTGRGKDIDAASHALADAVTIAGRNARDA
jgi:hypothetical protein